MNYFLSNHAKEKIKIRKIPINLIEEVLNYPQQTIEQDDLTIFQSIIKIKDIEYLLRIFVNTDKIPDLIVIVYLTNNISKYWREQ